MALQVGDVREIDEQRLGEGTVIPLRFGDPRGEDDVRSGRIGSVRVEVWNAEIVERLEGVVPVWPGDKGGTEGVEMRIDDVK